MKTLKPMGTVWLNVSAGLCRVHARDDREEEYDIEFKIDEFLSIAAKAQQEARSHSVREAGSEIGLTRDDTRALSVPVILPNVVEIATLWTTEPPKVLVVLDRETPAELAIGLSVSRTQKLAELLLTRVSELEYLDERSDDTTLQ